MTLTLASDSSPEISLPVKANRRSTDALGLPDLILAKFLAGEEQAAEIAARLAVVSGYSLTEIYESLRAAIYCVKGETTDVEALRIAELDQRLLRLATRLLAPQVRRREPEAIMLSTQRHGIPATICHILADLDIPSLTLELPHFARHRRGGAGIPHQFQAVRYVIIDAAQSGPQELARIFSLLQQLRLLSGEFTVVLLADNKLAADTANIHNSPHFTVARTLPAVMMAAGLASDNPLTAREQDVLSYISKGSTNQQAARSLGISIATVKTYLERAQSKLQSVDRASAVAVALRRGWM